MDSFIEAFHIDWKILIAQAINFAIVFAVLYFLALKPLKKVMSERTNLIEKGLENAKESAQLIASSQKEYEKVISDARTEAHTLFQEGKREAETKREEMMKRTEEEVASMIANGKKSLEGEKVKMVEEAKAEIVSLVVAATEKILKDQTNTGITEKAIKKVNNI